MKPPTWSVYIIKCLTSGRCYVGKSATPKQRWGNHKAAAFKPSNASHHLALPAAIRTHGADRFKFEVVATYDNDYDAFIHEEGLIKFHFFSGQAPFNSPHIMGPQSKAKIAEIYGERAVRKEYCTRVSERRDAIIKAWITGKSTAEIAKMIGASVGTVKYHLRNWRHQQSQEAKV